MPKQKQTARVPNRVRIIAGQWRGSRITFPDCKNIRPSPDRLRETLFNWLQRFIDGAHCLDLFAGSGVLGFEALSRGAQLLDSVDIDKQVVEHLKQQRQKFGILCGAAYQKDYRQYLQQCEHRYDIVFIDPPFHQSMAEQACQLIQQSHILNDNALIYAETHSKEAKPVIFNWEVVREKVVGEVRAMLCRRSG